MLIYIDKRQTTIRAVIQFNYNICIYYALIITHALKLFYVTTASEVLQHPENSNYCYFSHEIHSKLAFNNPQHGEKLQRRIFMYTRVSILKFFNALVS